MINNKRGQEVGTLTNMLIVLLCVSAVAVLGFSYIQGLSTNYGVAVNESEYTVFNKLGEVNSTISDISSQLIPEDPQQENDIDVISVLLSAAYGSIKLFLSIPSIWFSLIQSAIIALGLPASVGAVVATLSIGVIILLVIGAVIALLLKVRP